MLFNSYGFIFVYLPAVLGGFFLIAQTSHRLAALWLGAASLFFYGWWNAQFVLLLLASIVFNYAMGYAIGHARVGKGVSRNSFRLLVAAVSGNLLILAYFKYANFFISTAHQLTGVQWGLTGIVLPLGISFFTFTQIAFLVDVHRGIAREYNFIHYLLFVTYFPHLVAGPVLHHRQMMPQFGYSETYRPNIDNINIGLTIFTIGLFKKVILADQFALYANPVFDATANGGNPVLIEAWIGALAYTFQLYFDFSGYSDMAIGLSRLFNIKLPLNFDSPYKARNIIEFWRRWHMTLSAFLKDYLYVPMGGSRRGTVRRYRNLLMTMLLGGLWHGAGWNFVLWGGLHGGYLVINHAWRYLIGPDEKGSGHLRSVYHGLSILLTFSLVVIAWVPFRSTDFESALRMWAGMVGVNGLSSPAKLATNLEPFLGGSLVFGGSPPLTGLPEIEVLTWLLIGLGSVWLLPNTQQLMAKSSPAWETITQRSTIEWQPTKMSAMLCGAALALSILGMTRASQFLYFQF
jgi:alginate O-acetyltransferase complex protein AlgI